MYKHTQDYCASRQALVDRFVYSGKGSDNSRGNLRQESFPKESFARPGRVADVLPPPAALWSSY